MIRELGHFDIGSPATLKSVNFSNRSINQLFYALERQTEGIDGASQPFQKVDAHQAADTLLTPGPVDVDVRVDILVPSALKDKICWYVDCQIQLH